MGKVVSINRVPIIKIDNLMIDPNCRIVTNNGKEIKLQSKEFDVLYLLAQYPGWVLSKEQIYENVYGKEIPIEIDNIIYCLIYGIRKKLESSPKKTKYIQTVKGVGYKFVIPRE